MGASKWGFQKLNISEFENWVGQISVGRTILYLQQHHTNRRLSMEIKQKQNK